MPRIRRALAHAAAAARRRAPSVLTNLLAIAGVGCAAAGLWLVSPTLALLLVGGYLYWVAVGAATRTRP